MLEIVIVIGTIVIILLYLFVERLSYKSIEEKIRSDKNMHEEKNELENKVLEFEKATGYKIDDFLGKSPKVKAEETFIEKLSREDNEAFNKWFDRWYKKQNLKSKIIELNLQGKKSLQISLDYKDNLYLKRRLYDKRTRKRIAENLDGMIVGLVIPQSSLGIFSLGMYIDTRSAIDEPYIDIQW